MSYTEFVKELDAKIPREVVKTRDAGGGLSLDYLSGYYVIDRLNKVVGHGNWAYSSEVTKLHEGEVNNRHSVHYMAKVRLVVQKEDFKTEFIDYGYGDGLDKFNPGKAHELAIKESITDGLKRCAKNLGMSFGLALYSKEQENVREVEEVVSKEEKPTNRKIALEKIWAMGKVLVDSKRMTSEEIKSLVNSFGVKDTSDLSDKQVVQLTKELEERLNK